MLGGLKRLLKSSKAIAAVVGIAAAVGTRYLGLDPAVAKELSYQIVIIVAAYIGANALEDAAAKKNGNGGAP